MEFVYELLLFTIIEYTYRFLFHFHLINYLRKRYLFSQDYISGHEEIKNWTEFVNSEFRIIEYTDFYFTFIQWIIYLFSQDYISGHETEFKNSSDAEREKKCAALDRV